jgi:hypothetical protein
VLLLLVLVVVIKAEGRASCKTLDPALTLRLALTCRCCRR